MIRRDLFVRSLNQTRKHQLLAAVDPATVRWFSVKELSWCASPGSRSQRELSRNSRKHNSPNENEITQKKLPIARFGIVVATSKNRVIGINGQIPWKLPEDRKIFKSLTKNKILIVGRKTFEEQPGQCHIDHTKHCIVVSSTLDKNRTISSDNHEATDDENGVHKLHVTKSLDEALHLANILSSTKVDESNRLECWVGGGERLYAESLKHPSAQELHMSVVDLEVDVTNDDGNVQNAAYFPARYRWDNIFKQISKQEYQESTIGGMRVPAFTYFKYKRIRRKR